MEREGERKYMRRWEGQEEGEEGRGAARERGG